MLCMCRWHHCAADWVAMLSRPQMSRSSAKTLPPLSLQVSLFRADALSSVMELDKHLAITHVDEAAGLMFGVNPKQLLKKAFARYGTALLGVSGCAKHCLNHCTACSTSRAWQVPAAGKHTAVTILNALPRSTLKFSAFNHMLLAAQVGWPVCLHQL